MQSSIAALAWTPSQAMKAFPCVAETQTIPFGVRVDPANEDEQAYRATALAHSAQHTADGFDGWCVFVRWYLWSIVFWDKSVSNGACYSAKNWEGGMC